MDILFYTLVVLDILWLASLVYMYKDSKGVKG